MSILDEATVAMQHRPNSRQAPKPGAEILAGAVQHRTLFIATLAASLVAIGFVVVAAVLLGNDAAQRGWHLFLVTATTTLVLCVIAIVNAALAPLRPNDRAARVVLTALMVTMNVTAASYSYLAVTGGGKLDWLVIAPLPTWIFCAWYVPFLVDSPVLSAKDSAVRWKRLAGLPMLYCDPDDDALWMEFPGVSSSFSIQHTPNLGNRWGRVVMQVFVLLIATLVGAIIAT